MSIRKLRAGRVPNVTASSWVGERGTIFYDEATGQLKIADGTTPGGHFINLVVAASGRVGGIKPGPGVVISDDGTLVIDSSGLSFNFGDFIANTYGGGATLTSRYANEDINLISNGTGAVNVVGNLHVHATSIGGLSANPVFQIIGDGQAKFLVPIADSLTGAVEIIGSLDGVYQVPVNTGVMLHITGNPPQDGNSTPSRLYNDSQATYSLFAGRRYNGTASSPTQVKSGDTIVRYAGTGYANNGWPNFGSARMEVVADEDFTGAGQGGHLAFFATPVGKASGTANTVVVANMSATSGLTVYGNVTAGNVTVGGLTVANNVIYSSLTSQDLVIGQTGATANIVINRTTTHSKDVYIAGNIFATGQATAQNYRGNSRNAGTLTAGSTLTIDYTTDHHVLANITGAITIAHTNIVAGRNVKVVLVNATGVNYAVSTGVPDINSTGNNAGANLNASRMGVYEFISFGTLAANVYVSINK